MSSDQHPLASGRGRFLPALGIPLRPVAAASVLEMVLDGVRARRHASTASAGRVVAWAIVQDGSGSGLWAGGSPRSGVAAHPSHGIQTSHHVSVTDLVTGSPGHRRHRALSIAPPARLHALDGHDFTERLPMSGFTGRAERPWTPPSTNRYVSQMCSPAHGGRRPDPPAPCRHAGAVRRGGSRRGNCMRTADCELASAPAAGVPNGGDPPRGSSRVMADDHHRGPSGPRVCPCGCRARRREP